jgi:molybdate transport system ATP-binding protein
MPVAENVACAVACAAPRRARRARIDAARAQLAALGLTALADRSPGTLSGGEQQRVGLARALAARPRALLLDEPLAALDVRARRDVRDVLVETLASAAVPTIVVTHDAEDARRLGHRVVVLEAGRVTQEGTWDAIAASPATPFARRLATST